MTSHEDAAPSTCLGPLIVSLHHQPIQDLVRLRPIGAIVSSDDTNLSMGGGVSAAIAPMLDPETIAEARARTPLRVGDVVVSRLRDGPVRFVFHAVVVDWRNRVLPTERTYRQVRRDSRPPRDRRGAGPCA